MGHRGRCAIVGVGQTDYSKGSGRSEVTLATQAALAAVTDAGLGADDIDGIVHCDVDRVRPNDLAHALGLTRLTYWGATGHAGGAPCGMIGQAIGAILSGQATTVLVFRALNGRSGVRYGQAADGPVEVGGAGSYDEFFAPYGLVAPGQVWAMMMRRHMHEYGTRPEDLGHIALACRERANANPAAQMTARLLTMDDYLDSRLIASPLRLFDYCLETDGACAVVVTARDRARHCRQTPVAIGAVAQAGPADVQGGSFMPALMRQSVTTQPSAAVAETLYRRAGLGPADIDVAQLYDCFTSTVLFQLEDYGFCEKGEGGALAASGALTLGGRLPINTAGGNLSEGYLHGVNHIVEGVRQIRGQSTSQVPGAEVCLVTSGLPVATSALILTKG